VEVLWFRHDRDKLIGFYENWEGAISLRETVRNEFKRLAVNRCRPGIYVTDAGDLFQSSDQVTLGNHVALQEKFTE